MLMDPLDFLNLCRDILTLSTNDMHPGSLSTQGSKACRDDAFPVCITSLHLSFSSIWACHACSIVFLGVCVRGTCSVTELYTL